MKLLITGAGLIGTAVARTALTRGDQVVLVDAVPDAEYVRRRVGGQPTTARADVTDLIAMAAVLSEHRPDAVVHTAAIFGRHCVRAPALATSVNVGGTAAVLEAALRTGVGRVVLVSSLAVYPWHRLPPEPPVVESAATEPGTLYGATKLAAEQVAGAFADPDRLAVSALRLAGVYGDGRHRGGGVVGARLQRAVAEAVRTGRTTVPGIVGGRELLHCDDAAAAILRDVAVPLPRWRVLNIGTGRVTPLAEVAAALAAAVPGSRVDTGVDPVRSAAPALDLTTARTVLGELPVTPLPEGLRRLAELVRVDTPVVGAR